MFCFFSPTICHVATVDVIVGKKRSFRWLGNYGKHCNFSLLLFSCVSVLLDLNLRGSRSLRPRPQVCELCQAWDCWSLSHEHGWHGERRRWPHRSWSQPVHVSLWGRAGRWNELRDFLLASVKKRKRERERKKCERIWVLECSLFLPSEKWKNKTPMKC